MLDQIVKAIVRSTWLHESVVVIPSFFEPHAVHNTGAAFGLLNAAEFPFKTVVLSIVATLALGALSLRGATLPPNRAGAAGAGAHHWRCRRQPHRSRESGATLSISSTSTGGIGTSGRSTSPTPRSQWASSLMILDCCEIGRHRVSRAV